MQNPSERRLSCRSMGENPLTSVGFFGAFEGSGFRVRILWRRVERGWGDAGRVLCRAEVLLVPDRAVSTGRVALERGSRA